MNCLDRYLILENGKIFKGKAFGADKNTIAEIVFTTAMTGYIETLTDKSYAGQAIVQTFPLIGNYGIIPEDFESDLIKASAYIVREWCAEPSNFRCRGNLDTFLKENNIPGIYGIDTRSLTRVLREHGTMNGMICDSPENADFNEIKNYRIKNPISELSIKKPFLSKAENSKYTVAMLDFGRKENIVRSLNKRGCDVWVLPYHTTVEEIDKINPDGLFLTNGPGDPTDNIGVIDTLKKLFAKKYPTMGICLGHQLLALASGFATTRLKYGHRGANQPVLDKTSGKVYISSQNHGYAVVGESIDKSFADELFINVNDNTNEGLVYKKIPAFSVQFHPEACGGPKDTDFLFDKFINLMGGLCSAAE